MSKKRFFLIFLPPFFIGLIIFGGFFFGSSLIKKHYFSPPPVPHNILGSIKKTFLPSPSRTERLNDNTLGSIKKTFLPSPQQPPSPLTDLQKELSTEKLNWENSLRQMLQKIVALQAFNFNFNLTNLEEKTAFYALLQKLDLDWVALPEELKTFLINKKYLTTDGLRKIEEQINFFIKQKLTKSWNLLKNHLLPAKKTLTVTMTTKFGNSFLFKWALFFAPGEDLREQKVEALSPLQLKMLYLFSLYQDQILPAVFPAKPATPSLLEMETFYQQVQEVLIKIQEKQISSFYNLNFEKTVFSFFNSYQELDPTVQKSLQTFYQWRKGEGNQKDALVREITSYFFELEQFWNFFWKYFQFFQLENEIKEKEEEIKKLAIYQEANYLKEIIQLKIDKDRLKAKRNALSYDQEAFYPFYFPFQRLLSPLLVDASSDQIPPFNQLSGALLTELGKFFLKVKAVWFTTAWEGVATDFSFEKYLFEIVFKNKAEILEKFFQKKLAPGFADQFESKYKILKEMNFWGEFLTKMEQNLKIKIKDEYREDNFLENLKNDESEFASFLSKVERESWLFYLNWTIFSKKYFPHIKNSLNLFCNYNEVDNDYKLDFLWFWHGDCDGDSKIDWKKRQFKSNHLTISDSFEPASIFALFDELEKLWPNAVASSQWHSTNLTFFEEIFGLPPSSSELSEKILAIFQNKDQPEPCGYYYRRAKKEGLLKEYFKCPIKTFRFFSRWKGSYIVGWVTPWLLASLKYNVAFSFDNTDLNFFFSHKVDSSPLTKFLTHLFTLPDWEKSMLFFTLYLHQYSYFHYFKYLVKYFFVGLKSLEEKKVAFEEGTPFNKQFLVHQNIALNSFYDFFQAKYDQSIKQYYWKSYFYNLPRTSQKISWLKTMNSFPAMQYEDLKLSERIKFYSIVSKKNNFLTIFSQARDQIYKRRRLKQYERFDREKSSGSFVIRGEIYQTFLNQISAPFSKEDFFADEKNQAIFKQMWLFLKEQSDFGKWKQLSQKKLFIKLKIEGKSLFLDNSIAFSHFAPSYEQISAEESDFLLSLLLNFRRIKSKEDLTSSEIEQLMTTLQEKIYEIILTDFSFKWPIFAAQLKRIKEIGILTETNKQLNVYSDGEVITLSPLPYFSFIDIAEFHKIPQAVQTKIEDDFVLIENPQEKMKEIVDLVILENFHQFWEDLDLFFEKLKVLKVEKIEFEKVATPLYLADFQTYFDQQISVENWAPKVLKKMLPFAKLDNFYVQLRDFVNERTESLYPEEGKKPLSFFYIFLIILGSLFLLSLLGVLFLKFKKWILFW